MEKRTPALINYIVIPPGFVTSGYNCTQKQKFFRLTAMSSICKAYITGEFYFILRLKAWIFRDNIPECLAFRDEHFLLLGNCIRMKYVNLGVC